MAGSGSGNLFLPLFPCPSEAPFGGRLGGSPRGWCLANPAVREGWVDYPKGRTAGFRPLCVLSQG
jgi:hypothetical protein